MVQWGEHLPPTNVARVQIMVSTRYVGVEFVVGSFPSSERFFSRYSGFILSSKANISRFQFDKDLGRRTSI